MEAVPRWQVQRKFARYQLDVRAKMSAGGGEAIVRTLDISEGGMGVVSPVRVAAQDRYRVELIFPFTQGTFQATMELRNHSGFRYGFEFVELDEASRASFRKYERRWGVASRD